MNVLTNKVCVGLGKIFSKGTNNGFFQGVDKGFFQVGDNRGEI